MSVNIICEHKCSEVQEIQRNGTIHRKFLTSIRPVVLKHCYEANIKALLISCTEILLWVFLGQTHCVNYGKKGIACTRISHRAESIAALSLKETD